MLPDDIRTGITIGGVIGSILGALGIAKWSVKNHEDRLKVLESANSVSDDACTRRQNTCPVLLMVQNDREVLQEIKTGQKELIKEMRTEFKQHAKLHLKIAEDIGRLNEREGKP